MDLHRIVGGVSLLAASTLAAAQGGTLLLGQTADYSGPQAAPVKETAAAARAYFDWVNAHGGVNGRKIVLESMDDGYDTKRTVENAKKLIDEKGVLALFLFRGTANAEALLPVIAEKKTLLFGGVGSSMKMHQPMNRYMFNLRSPVQTEVASIVGQLASQGIKDLAVIYTDDGFGKDAMEGATKAFEKHKLTPTAVAAIPRGQVEVDEAVDKIAKVKPSATIGFCIPKICATVVKKLRAQGSLTQFFSLSNTSSGAYVKELGEHARGVVVTQVMPYPFDARDAIGREFITFAKEAKIPQSYGTMEGYLSARIMTEALKRAGRNPTRESLLQAFESLHLNLGGFNVGFSPTTRTGSEFVDLTMISKDGKFIR
ncbi:MAG TPA: ABC transporter substrate-binding protein [Usitatibacter sp.]|nr:ABC transporter substrate-binding protein [Usitatibacter sp.]